MKRCGQSNTCQRGTEKKNTGNRGTSAKSHPKRNKEHTMKKIELAAKPVQTRTIKIHRQG
ncbi:hypothetical protein M2167_002714 [Streptomyces sp. SPB4]|nr:hypothetical protein [Streptomyces sp. SPB4]